ncbi:MAG: NAD(P)-dependent oxidoreductase [Xanthobacteraceae bacterium]|jgi:D-3-phosphoglycerate dehydrogenase
MLQKMDTAHHILVRNKIHPAGLALFGASYTVGPKVDRPDMIALRSDVLYTKDYGDTLFAVGRAGVGLNNIDEGKFDTATERGICIFNAPGANSRSVAQITMAAIMGNARHIADANSASRSFHRQEPERIKGYVEQHKSQFPGFELEAKTLGVIGLGYAGVEVVNLAIKIGMKVVGYDTHLTLQHALRLTNDENFSIARSMEQVLRSADIITVHVPLNDKTKHLIGRPQIELMRDDATVVNYAREDIYDDAAVIEALDRKKLSYYLNDFPSSDLVHTKVYSTMHQGASTPESEKRCAVMVCQQLKDFAEFGTVVNSVNFPTVEVPLHSDTRTRITIVNKDIPGMIASYTGLLAGAGINIPSVSGDNNGTIGYYIIDVPTEVPSEVLRAINDVEGVIRVRAITMSR